jgi:phosphonate transport system substrate-binding protein
MKKLLPVLLLGLLACGGMPALQPTPTAVPTALPTPTAGPLVALPSAAPGTAQNPLVLSLAPAPRLDENALNASKVLIGMLEKSTGYRFETIAPASEPDLIARFKAGVAQIGVLSPFGYLQVSQEGSASAAFARQQDGSAFYGAEFIVRVDAGYTPYFDPIKKANSIDFTPALAQLAGKKPCWSDPYSPSSYVVPLGLLKEAGVETDDPAFVTGQPTVVRAVYAGGICDFGAVYVDARAYPGLQDQYPDVMKKVIILWQIPPFIPHEVLVFGAGLSDDMRRALTRAFVDAMTTPDGNSAMQTLYGINAMQVAQDGDYQQFRKVVKDSGIPLGSLLK